MITRENFKVQDFHFSISPVMELGPNVTRTDKLVAVEAPSYFTGRPIYLRLIITTDPTRDDFNKTVAIVSDGNGSLHQRAILEPLFISNFTQLDDVIGEMVETFNLNELNFEITGQIPRGGYSGPVF